jgi:hypothetical protein
MYIREFQKKYARGFPQTKPRKESYIRSKAQTLYEQIDSILRKCGWVGNSVIVGGNA